ncbi:MAG: transglutaminase-like domain-containing protein [Planctomycetota bacterium]|nr:transglutaminase-like domain-containing protein [Planctomycetota bacterium]
MKKFHPLRSILVLALIAFMATTQLMAQDATDRWELQEDLWYELDLADAKTGWMHAQIFDDGKNFRTDVETKMKIARGPVQLEITMKSSFTETHDGVAVRMKYLQDMSTQVVETEWIFKDDKALMISSQGGRKKTKTFPMPEGDWLTPMALDRFIAAQIEAGKTSIKYSMLSPEEGIKPIHVTMQYVGDDMYAIDELAYAVTVWESETSILAVKSKELYDAEFNMLFSEVEFPFGKIATRLSTREKVMGEDQGQQVAQGGGAGGAGGGNVAPNGLPVNAPELMIETFIKVSEPIKNPYDTTTASLRLRAKKGKLPELPSAGAQRAMDDPETGDVLLTIDINDNLPASGEDIANPDYLDPSTMIDGSDPYVRKLTKRAVKNASDDKFERAELMRKYVHGYISNKGLATAFASASETARQRSGDCSEHGVLLAALLRADGIPSRVATGLVYVDSFLGQENIFGWHMWTQALIDDKWVDFDATLPNRYSSTHVLTATSSMADGEGSDQTQQLLLLLGNLEIEVEEVGYDQP